MDNQPTTSDHDCCKMCNHESTLVNTCSMLLCFENKNKFVIGCIRDMISKKNYNSFSFVFVFVFECQSYKQFVFLFKHKCPSKFVFVYKFVLELVLRIGRVSKKLYSPRVSLHLLIILSKFKIKDHIYKHSQEDFQSCWVDVT